MPCDIFGKKQLAVKDYRKEQKLQEICRFQATLDEQSKGGICVAGSLKVLTY